MLRRVALSWRDSGSERCRSSILRGMALVVTDAIVLHSFDYLESSRILRLATREGGVQSVLARGARRSRSRFGSAVDLFAEGVAHIHTRPGRDLSTLSGFDVSRSRAPISLSLERFAAASAIAELTLRFFQDEAHEALYDELRRSLDDLAEAAPDDAREAGIASAWRLIGELGFAPAIDRCCVCHVGVAPADSVRFSHAGGGVVCPRCGPLVSSDRTLPPEARDALRSWLGGGRVALVGEATRRAHQRLLREFLMEHLADARELRALEAWERGSLRSA